MMSANKAPVVSVCAALLSALLASSAVAQSGGSYFQIAAGSTESRTEPLIPLSPTSQISESTRRSGTYSLIGGWRFNDHLAVEINYTDHGSFSDRALLTELQIVVEQDPVSNDGIEDNVDARLDADVEYELVSYGVSLLANWPLSRRWNVYGRLGLMSWEADSSIKGHLAYRGDLERDWSVSGKLSDSGSSFSYGVGVFYRFTRSYAATL